MTDEELIRGFCRGNAEAMSELFVRYRKSVYIWFKQVLPGEADDLYQELWLRVIKKASSFSGSSFRVWMWKIARNMVIDVYKKKRPLLLTDVEGENEADLIGQMTHLNEASFLEELDFAERKDLMRECIEALPQKQKEVVLLRICTGLSFAEISGILSSPLNTVLGRMHRAVDGLKTLIRERLGENG